MAKAVSNAVPGAAAITQSARERILEVAGGLFFKYGYRAIGIDTIIAESGVAKATLYRHFPSKDDLITAYLEHMNVLFWAWFDKAAATADNPREQLVAVFKALETLVTTPTCYGCPFLMAATEFPDPEHPGHRTAVANKNAVRERLTVLCQQASVPSPELIGSQLLLMMDGAFMAVRLYGVDNPAATVSEQAAQLLACTSLPNL